MKQDVSALTRLACFEHVMYDALDVKNDFWEVWRTYLHVFWARAPCSMAVRREL